ncbi:restriction endonuclease subunit S [Chromobacterium violaceum]
MSGLPNGWETVQIGHLIELNPKNACADDIQVGFVPMPMLGTRYLDKVAHESKTWAEVKKGYTHFADGDVLLAKITPCFENGKAGIPSGLPNKLGAGSTEYFVCRPYSFALDARYLLAYFKTDQFVRSGAIEMTGSVGHKRVPKVYVTDTAIPLAPLPEQKRIADKLDSVLARVDACCERLARVQPLLKRFRQSVLAAAMSGRLTEDWRTERAPDYKSGAPISDGDLVDQAVNGQQASTPSATSAAGIEPAPINNGYRTYEIVQLGRLVAEPLRNGKSVKDGAGQRVLRLSSLKSGRIDFNESKSGSWDGIDYSRFLVREGDFLIARGNGSKELVGRGGLIDEVPEAMAYPDTMIRVRPNSNKLHPQYLKAIWDSQVVRQQIEVGARTTAGIWKISQGDLESLWLPLPTLSEQHEIVRRVETLFAFADRLEARLAAVQGAADKLTPALLAKAFRGELVPQDPNDEPAAELLQRLAAQRAAAPKPKRGRKAASAGD